VEGFVVDGVIDARQGEGRTGPDAAPAPPAPDLDEAGAAALVLLRRAVPGAAHAGVLIDHPGGVTRFADGLAQALDTLQAELAEGPGPQAVRDEIPVHVGDLARFHDRWPRFVPRALDLGARGVLSVPVCARGTCVGRVDVVSTEVDALTRDSLEVAALVATHLSAAAAATSQVHQLEVALRSRDVIGQAKGVLMERHGIGADRAFEVLVRYSRSGNTKLRDVAERLVTTRSLPDDAGPQPAPRHDG
jgi:hypothetical protein